MIKNLQDSYNPFDVVCQTFLSSFVEKYCSAIGTALFTFSMWIVGRLISVRINNNVFITEHDDRVNDAIRHVSFKPRNNHIGKHRNRGMAPFIPSRVVDDDDVDMNVPGSSGRNTRL
jgi:hypothetical protein